MEKSSPLRPSTTEPIGKDPFGNTIFFSEADVIHRYPEQLHRLLTAVAHVMTELEPDEWIKDVFVSDRSSIGDFTKDPDDIAAIAKELDLHEGIVYIPLHRLVAIMSIEAGEPVPSEVVTFTVLDELIAATTQKVYTTLDPDHFLASRFYFALEAAKKLSATNPDKQS